MHDCMVLELMIHTIIKIENVSCQLSCRYSIEPVIPSKQMIFGSHTIIPLSLHEHRHGRNYFLNVSACFF